jgi:hypothetical protein
LKPEWNVNPHLPYGLVQVSTRTFYIVQGGTLGVVPMWYAVEGEPVLRSLSNAIARVKELNGKETK